MKRKGSALLIVLGMMAFIVVSAIAFAAYMRHARMPSSYLRRTSSSRLLAKAALANAIDILDESIGNSAYPGQSGILTKNYSRISSNNDERKRVTDHWCGRCFIGPTNGLASTDTTVSTLCLEALAYIPPPLINEVRYYSRRSLAGQWHSMSFDAGRFAFCAVDVSDYFDVNRVRCLTADANGQEIFGRNSSDMGRISLAHCFENLNHTGYRIQPSDWDDFMESFLENQTKVPIVSLADLNLAINKKGLDEALTPFCRFIKNGTAFVKSATGEEAALQRNLCFVADSCFAPTNAPLDLAAGENQPFYGMGSAQDSEKANDLPLSEITRLVYNNYGNHVYKNQNNADKSPFFFAPQLVQLYDYLDKDSLPSSLVLPTVERTPMITGVSLRGGFGLEIVKGTDTKKIDDKTQYAITTYTLKILCNQLRVTAGFVYPFKYKRKNSPPTYTAQASATLAFVSGLGTSPLRKNNAQAPAIATGNDGWSGATSWSTATFANDGKPSVARALSQTANCDLSTDGVTDEDSAILTDGDMDLSANLNGLAFAAKLPQTYCYNENTCTFRTCVRMTLTDAGWVQDPTWTENSDATPIADRIGFLPLKETLDGTIAADQIGSSVYQPTLQIWVRIKGPDGVVDLVPACLEDDASKIALAETIGIGATAKYPMLRFYQKANPIGVQISGNELKLSGDGGNLSLYPQAYLADDPRFNFAPENLIALETISEKFNVLWKSQQRSGADDRDGDIFMACSDAGYLQSAYELAYLLRVSEGTDTDAGWGCLKNGYDGEIKTAFTQCPADRAMWRTYSQYDSGCGGGDIDYLGIVNGTRGFRQTPFAQSLETLLPVFANAPVDWWAASTNDANDSVKQTALSSASGAAKYQFTEMSGGTYQMKHDDVEAFAEKFMSTMRNAQTSASNWRDRFDDMGWDGGSENQVCGVTFNGLTLHSVDRKFLHGYFKDCFDNRQQLFLVFVRAEPTMLGGGGVGLTPPQLGSRAVAVVWRDPQETKDDNYGTGTSGNPVPHRTRILFYRQFD